MIVMSITEFAAKRRGDQDDMEKDLYPHVAEAIQAYPVVGWYDDLLRVAARTYLSVFHNEGGTGEPNPSAADFVADLRSTLDKTTEPTATTVDRISVWLATAILNAGTQAAAATDEEFLVMEWVTMHDEDVRPPHVSTEGQQRPPGEPFDVAGTEMRYPGDTGGGSIPIDLWINCRCTLAPVLASEANFRKTEGVIMTATETETETAELTPLAWHGVLAPEGIWSGDGRMFAPDALRFRDLPIPLTWQKATSEGHDGSVVIGRIDSIERVDGMMNATGVFLSTVEADEVIALIAEFGKFGVSVDADDAEFEFNEDDGRVTFTSARIASASVVSIPAFAEAFIALGPWAGETEEVDVCDDTSPGYDAAKCAEKQDDKPPEFNMVPNPTLSISTTTNGAPTWTTTSGIITYVSDAKWDGSASRFTDEQWKSSCCLHVCDGMEKSCHKLPIKEPGGALSRAGVHAAAARFNQVDAPAEAKSKAKATLRGAYKTLGEEVPDVLAEADVATFKDLAPGITEDGPGWLTHPVDTDRLRDYWVRGEGAAKIGWGTPGDFNRCRANLAKYVKPQYLSGYCANRHYDALGFWPGEHASAETIDVEGRKRWAEVAGSSLSLVASAAAKQPPADWFTDPHLTGPTHLTVTDEGRVFGHIAEWGVCHIGFNDVCTVAPHSTNDYAYYATGRVLLDDGSTARTGVISLGGGHASHHLRARPAMAHYDSTSVAVADVAVGEDEYGIWCAGWIRPGTTEEQVIALRASDVSGDWRDLGNDEIDMVAALAVNVGGFPVGVHVNDGRQVTLVAAGMVSHSTDSIEALVDDVELRLRQRKMRRLRMKTLVARVGGE